MIVENLIVINKIFNNNDIRSVRSKEDEKYYVSIVDVVGVLSESDNPRDYWYKIKKRASTEEKIELSTICRQFKLKSKDGKYRLTDVWKEGGIKEGIEFSILTDEIYKEWSGMNASQYKCFKGLRKENLRDNMDAIELVLTDLSEETTKLLAQLICTK